MKFRYRGVSHQRYLFQQTVPQSMQILCYRGVVYIQEMPLFASGQSSAVVHSRDNGTQPAAGYESYVQQNQRMGQLYRLYCLGWRNGSLGCFSLLQHWLFSAFVNYRRGYSEGIKCR